MTGAVGSRQAIVAVLLMAVGSALAPLMDALGKDLTASYPVSQIVWMRYVAHAAMAGAAALALDPRPGTLRPTRLQFVRGTTQFLSSVFLLWSLVYLSLATALVVVFLAPLLVVVARAVQGKADADRTNVLLAAAGSLAAALVYSPTGASGFGLLLALAAAALVASYLLLTGVSAARASIAVNGFHAALPGALLGAPLAALSFDVPRTAREALTFLSIGALSAVAHSAISAAMRTPLSSAVAPIAYAEIPFGMLYGVWLFGQIPTAGEIVGGAMVVLAGGLIAARLRRVTAV